MSPSRRDFLKTSAATTLGAAMTNRVPAFLSSRSPSDKLVVAVVGLNGRGAVHAQNFGRQMENAELAYLCDVDATVLAKAQEASTAEARAPDRTDTKSGICGSPNLAPIACSTAASASATSAFSAAG